MLDEINVHSLSASNSSFNIANVRCTIFNTFIDTQPPNYTLRDFVYEMKLAMCLLIEPEM